MWREGRMPVATRRKLESRKAMPGSEIESGPVCLYQTNYNGIPALQEWIV